MFLIPYIPLINQLFISPPASLKSSSSFIFLLQLTYFTIHTCLSLITLFCYPFYLCTCFLKITCFNNLHLLILGLLTNLLPCTAEGSTKLEPCLTWDTLDKMVPWGIVILVGGSLALAEGAKKSGLSMLFSQQMIGARGLPKEALQVLVCLLAAGMTEITSNTATASILLPILANLVSD